MLGRSIPDAEDDEVGAAALDVVAEGDGGAGGVEPPHSGALEACSRDVPSLLRRMKCWLSADLYGRKVSEVGL